MPVYHLGIEELSSLAPADPRFGLVPGEPNIVIVSLDDAIAGRAMDPTLPAVVVARATSGAIAGPEWCDTVVVDDQQLDAVVKTVNAVPSSAVALMQVLRNSTGRSLGEGLVVESAVFSALQAGPEFLAWLETRETRVRRATDSPRVLSARMGDELTIVLNRPDVRNALDRAMRDDLLEALALASIDPSITSVEMRGNGPSYSAGGDLYEFGSFPDPATAHLVRTSAAIGPRMRALDERLTVRVHGPCAGSGIELPAFAAHVVADQNTTFSLPELALGLIPGAGGTWSLPRRIGRHRTALLALTGMTIDASTALDWGLVDALMT